MNATTFQNESGMSNRPKTSNDFSPSDRTSDTGTDWEVPIIDEEALDRLTTMFTLYTT